MIILNEKENKVKQKFIRFLKEENAFPLFVKEFNKLHRDFVINFEPIEESFQKYKFEIYSFNFFIKQYSQLHANFIFNAFEWYETNDQNRFWSNLNNKETRLWGGKKKIYACLND